jgi:hypothetical protein
MITLYFWACLVASGECSQKTLVRFGSPLACFGLAPQLEAKGWVDDRPKYRLRIDRDHPIECIPKEERGA